MAGAGADGFAASRDRFEQVAGWLESQEATELTHAELEEQLDARGRQLLRQLHQDHPGLRAAREQRREEVTGSDGIARTRAETGHQRGLATVFGEVTVTRMACRAPGAANLHPAGAILNLPEEKHSHGLRKLTAIESARGSFEQAGQAISRATGVSPGKRQAEQLAAAAAADVDRFYAARRPGPRPDTDVLVLQADGKGIVMRPGALRETTARTAKTSRHKLATRLSPGEKRGRKRICATRRSVISPAKPGGIRREVPGSDG